MKNKKLLICTLLGVSTLAIGAVVGVASSKKAGFRAYADPIQGEWHHYSRREATSSQLGVREYWVQCGGVYQFSAPSDVEIVDKGSSYDLSGFEEFDDRYFTYAMDEHYYDFSVSLFGAQMLLKSEGNYSEKNFRINQKGESYLHYSVYGDNEETFRIDLPRIDYRVYPHVHMDLTCPDWNQNNYFGPEDDDLTYTTVYGGNKNKGKIEFLYYDGVLKMDFYDPEYGNLWFTKTYTDTNVINGLASPCFYVTNRWDRYLNIDNITLSKHVDNGVGICTTCGHVIGGHKLSETLFTTSLEPDNNPVAPAGFANVTRQTAKHNTNSYLNNIDLSNYKKLYFDIYLKNNCYFFSGNAPCFWTDRWNQFYMEYDGEKWHAYGKDPGNANYTELTVDNQSSNWMYMFSVIRADWNTSEFDLFTTELIGVAK